MIAAARALADARIAQERASAAHVFALEKVTNSSRPFLWPPNGGVFSGTIQNVAPPADVLIQWGSKLSSEAFDVDLTLLRDTDNQASNPATDQATSSPDLGIRYRSPVNGILEANVAGRRRRQSAGPVPQMGQLMVLPFTNRAFQQNALSAKFSEDGTLLEASYGELASRAERASSTAARIAAMGPGAVQDAASARNFGLEQRAARLRAQRDVLLATQELQTAQRALATSPDDANERRRRLLDADTTLKNAERANIEAELALREATARLAATPAVGASP
ncbi:hypothetical protein [Falsiroseomonas sp. HW251]|uniref:hypothetical protein n=1 Tax=Falsiroseomonas sp. HW251 TaxID=3390998 RepID=UPI003D32117B